MPEGQGDLARPSIIVSENAPLGIRRRITDIDARIHKNPELFAMSLKLIGELATSQTVEIGDRGDSIRNLSRKPADLIIEFFRNRYDIDSDYDETTESSIAADPSYRQLVANMRSKTPERIQTGQMTSHIRPNLEAVPARDLVRRSRFGIYLGRVATYQNQQQLFTQEGSAGLQAAEANDLRANGTTGMGVA